MSTAHETARGCAANESGSAAPSDEQVSGGVRSESAGTALARELQRRWRSGDRATAEQLLNMHPELWRQPEAAVEVIYEEFCQRQAAGERDIEQDVMCRFPQWREPLNVMLDCHRLLQSPSPPDYCPRAGDYLGGFQLVAEIGTGARGRVWLATETGLADRFVVLKITPREGIEHLSLARLQHTHIVPVYSVTDDFNRNQRILCMPYFGRITLFGLLESLKCVPPAARTGRSIAAVITQRSTQSDSGTCDSAPAASLAAPDSNHPSRGAAPTAPALQLLAHVSYEQAACWITASLADALEFAHERGLVHLDVKPSNVLLAGDGQPMLLDFHLAREPIRPGGPLPDSLGGTPAYMPPEQRDAMQAIQCGRAVTAPVDGRADIYALGVILYEMLGGSPPSTEDPKPVCSINPQVSVGLSDIVAKCLALSPADRYSRAAVLADDLRRHLAHEPLLGVSNRSVAERWQKWRRRRPNTLGALGTAAAVAAALLFAAAGTWLRAQEKLRDAVAALHHGSEQLNDGAHTMAITTLERGLASIDAIPFQHDLARQLIEKLAEARRRRAAAQLHDLADQVRAAFGSDHLPPARLRTLGELCDEFWGKRQEIAATLDAGGDPAVATDLLDVAIFAAQLKVQLAGESELAAARAHAVHALDVAESTFGPNAVLRYLKDSYAGPGSRQVANWNASPYRGAMGPDADRMSATTAWEHYALGRAMLNAGELHSAAVQLEAARSLDPAGLWPNFYLGICAYRLGKYDDAAASFSVCIGAAPTHAACFHNRALTFAALGQWDRARSDFERARQLDADWTSRIPTAARSDH